MERLRHRIGKLVIAACSSLLVTAAAAQTPEVTLKASQTAVAPQEPVTITIASNIPGMIKVDYPVEFISDYGTADGMEQRLDPSTGRIITSHYLQQSGRFGKKGVYKFRASIKYRGREIYSNYLTITVRDAVSAPANSSVSLSNKPIAAVLELSKRTIYEGEAVLIRPRVYSTLDLKRFDDYSAPKPDAVVENHPFEQVNFELHRVRVNGKQANSFEYGKELLFPVTVGSITFSPFEMTFEYQSDFFLKPIKVKSSPAVLKVKPLPSGAPASFIGGVGKFSLESAIEKTELKQGEVFTVVCKISGLGNLQNIDEPKLVLPAGFQLYGDADRTEEITYGENGAEGEVTYKIHVQVLKAGAREFPGVEISWFNPATGRYESQRSQPVQLKVAPDASFRSTTITQPATTTKFEKPVSSKVNSRLIVLIASGGIILIGLLLLFFRIRSKAAGKKGSQIVAQATSEAHMPAGKAPVIAAPAEPDYMAEARLALNNTYRFAALLPKAIAQQVAAHAGIENDPRSAAPWLANRGTPAAMELTELLELCDHYRYGFGAVHIQPDDLLRRAEKALAAL